MWLIFINLDRHIGSAILNFLNLNKDHRLQKPRNNSFQVNLINFYKPRPQYWIRHFEFFKSECRSVISDPRFVFRTQNLICTKNFEICRAVFLYMSGGTYSLKSTLNDRFFEKLFMAFLFYSREFLPEICWEEIAEEILFAFYFYVWPGTRTLAFRLISQHTTY